MPNTLSDLELPAVRIESIPPDPKGTAVAFRRIGYSLEEALSDLVDNSLDANSSRVLIRFFRNNRKIVRVAVVDDGDGMNEEILQRAMQYGAQLGHKDSDLGKYGIGLKVASFSQCQSLSVLTKQNGVVSARRWRLEKIFRGWQCEVLNPAVATRIFAEPWSDLKLRKSGTIVLWDDLDTLGETGTDLERFISRRISHRLPVELGMRFHRFISGKKLRIRCDVQNVDQKGEVVPVEVPALNPFGYSKTGKTGYPITLGVAIAKEGVLALKAHVWPAMSKQREYVLGGGRVAERQGLYFYRNDRLIQGGGWNGLRDSDSEPHSSLARVEIDLPPSMDSIFSLSIQKSKVVAPPEFKTAAMEARCGNTSFNDYLAAAELVYRDENEEDEEEISIPGVGISASLRKKLTAILSSNGAGSREISFEWRRLEKRKFFELDRDGHTIQLNITFRNRLVEKGSHQAADAPMVKSLMFLLFSRDFRKERTSKKREEWYELCNRILLATVKSIHE